MPKFEIGQVIRHVRYDYRGVVAGVDGECRADEEWYLRNRTQPNRDQPWYHVLVDGGRETYVAETSIEPDAEGVEVEHPLVPKLFSVFLHGRYYRFNPN